MSEILPYTLCRTPTCRTTKEPGYADRGLCAPCEQAGVDALRELPANHCDLLPLVWDKPTATGGACGIPFGPSEPIHLATDALVREIVYVTGQWEEITRDRVRLSPPKGRNVAAACALLADHFTALLACPPWPVAYYDRTVGDMDGLDAITAITTLHRRSVARIGATPMTKQLPELCPNCRRGHLRQTDGRDTVRCLMCRQVWPWDQYMAVVESQIFAVAA